MLLEYTNIFHTLCSNIGIKDDERNLVPKYQSGLHKYIQLEMDFFDKFSLGVSYKCVVKIEQKFKKRNKREFRSTNPPQQKHGK
jgi:hypothetical protein